MGKKRIYFKISHFLNPKFELEVEPNSGEIKKVYLLK